jgi:hypothetical protein
MKYAPSPTDSGASSYLFDSNFYAGCPLSLGMIAAVILQGDGNAEGHRVSWHNFSLGNYKGPYAFSGGCRLKNESPRWRWPG